MLQNVLMPLRAGFSNPHLFCCQRNCLSLRQRAKSWTEWYGSRVEHSEWEVICTVAEETSNRRNEAAKVTVDGIAIDGGSVTNAEFRKFVDATGYKTTAERPVDWEELKKKLLPDKISKPPDEMLQPGSLVSLRRSGQWTCKTRMPGGTG